VAGDRPHGHGGRFLHVPNKTVWQLIRERFPVSLIFGITGFVLTYLICIPLGIAKALRHGSTFDLLSSVVVFTGYAIPAFAFGMLLRSLLCGTTTSRWMCSRWPASSRPARPSVDGGEDQGHRPHMFLPVLCYMIGNFAVLTLLMKNSLLEQVSQDYVRTVLAKGGSLRRAVWGHALRNALIPVATGFGGVLTVMFAGSVLIEKVFEIPGMGRLSLDAIISRDYMLFMGITRPDRRAGPAGPHPVRLLLRADRPPDPFPAMIRDSPASSGCIRSRASACAGSAACGAPGGRS
jgi:microcin C transport system permease protein